MARIERITTIIQNFAEQLNMPSTLNLSYPHILGIQHQQLPTIGVTLK